jgi:RNA polymerase primary sigma factor
MKRTSRQMSEPMNTYLREISAAPLLTREEELSLANRVAQGDPEARDHMARANLRLVISLAAKYLGRGLALEDLVAEGNLGLMRAVEGYDPSKETRFVTYASFWIKQSLRSAVQRQGRSVRMPAYTHSLLLKWHRASDALSERLGRAPTDEEIGEELKLSKQKFKVALQSLHAARLTFATFDDMDSHGLDGSLAIPKSSGPHDALEQNEALAQLSVWVKSLDVREAAVIRMRFGIDGGAPKNLREIGDELGLTRERVRQLEKKAIERLRSIEVHTD